MTIFDDELPRALTFSGFLNGTSGGVVQTSECSDGIEGPILFLAMTRKV